MGLFYYNYLNIDTPTTSYVKHSLMHPTIILKYSSQKPAEILTNIDVCTYFKYNNFNRIDGFLSTSMCLLTTSINVNGRGKNRFCGIPYVPY